VWYRKANENNTGTDRQLILNPEFFGQDAIPQDPGIRAIQQQKLQRQLGLLGVNARLSGTNPLDEINSLYALQLKLADLETNLAKAEQERYQAAIDGKRTCCNSRPKYNSGAARD
jgi:hypothetical protein